MERTLGITITDATGTQMDVASGGGSRGGTSSPSGDESSNDKRKDKKQKETSLRKLIGIDLSIGAMLKQSQIFTGFLGSVFQLIGMLVDVVLAPLAPYLFKLVGVVSGWIPKIGSWSETAVQWLKDAVNYLADLVDFGKPNDFGVPELVEQGFRIMSISGLGAMVGSEFALKFKGMGWNPANWKFSDLFEPIEQSDVVDDVKSAFKTGNKGIGAAKAFFSGLTKGLSFAFLAKIGKIAAAGIKGLGTMAMLVGIPLAIAEVWAAFKEGETGKAITKLIMNMIAFAVPIIIGIIATGVVPGIIAALVIGAAMILWELLVPEETKQKVYDFVGKLFSEIGDVFKELFTLGGGSLFSKVINGLILLFMGPINMIRIGLSMILSEDMKRTINDGVRNIAESLVNGLIGMINSIISWAMDMIPKKIDLPFGQSWTLPQMHDFQIAEADFSSFNLMMGVDSLGSRSSSVDLAMAGNVANQ